MKNFKISALLLVAALSLTGCARDLSSETYTSDSTLNIVLEGVVVSARAVKVKETDRLGDNNTGAAVGGITGGAIAHSSGGNAATVVGSAVAGGMIGALSEGALSVAKGTEFIVKVDKSKLSDNYYEGSVRMRNALASVKATGMVTIIQAAEKVKEKEIQVGEKVLVIVSENRSRVIRDVSK